MITPQWDAAQKIAKSLRVRGLRDYMYHPRVVVTDWVLSQSTRIGAKMCFEVRASLGFLTAVSHFLLSLIRSMSRSGPSKRLRVLATTNSGTLVLSVCPFVKWTR